MAALEALVDGVRRVTWPLPFALDHVHSYVLERPDGTHTVVDPGLNAATVEQDWGPLLGRLGAPVAEIVVTHYHPDHVGAAAALARLVGAPVRQSRLDREQSLVVWGDEQAPVREAAHLRRHGMPADEAGAVERHQRSIAARMSLAADVTYLEAGDDVGGWEVVQFPGHADAHLSLVRGDVLIAGDIILAPITPNIGLYPESGHDPLGRYLETLRRLEDVGPLVAMTGHGAPIEDVAGRAREITAHHADRLSHAGELLDDRPRTAYDVSRGLFGAVMAAEVRHFALAETLAHLERLVEEGRAERLEEDGLAFFGAAA